jgi:polysaccharide biosynthesis/export protein
MRRGALVGVLVAIISAASTGNAPAQQRSPTESEAVRLQRQLQASGLSPSQIRARLQAEGYPSGLLDAYLPGGMTDTTGIPGEDVLTAVRALGVVDTLVIDSLRIQRSARLTVAQIDSALRQFADSTGTEYELLEVRPEELPLHIQSLIKRRADLLRAQRLARERVDSGFTLFGLDLFRRETSQFNPSMAGPVDGNYRLGPGDRLVLILTGDVEAAYSLDVTREGFVVIPQVGQVHVANLTLEQFETLLGTRLRRVYSGAGSGPGATTRYSVSVARLRSNQVYVIGDVATPGSYQVSSAGTVLSALYAAGGPTENGSLRSVELKRGRAVAGRLDVYDYLLRGDASNDLRLETGDVVFVPPREGRVRIWGEVIRPATYELKPGETLAQMIRAAGGLTSSADRRRIQIERILPPEQRGSAGSDRVLMDLGSDNGGGELPAIPLQPGDVVRVFEIPDRLRSRVAVTGNVWTPGPIGFTPGMRLSDALRLAGGLRPDSYLGQVLVSRLQADSTRIQLRASVADTTGRAVNDIELADADEIQVFSQTEFRPRRYVVVSGAVGRSGRYLYREGMTLRDLVLLAGGLLESALLTEAEIARLSENRAAGETARTMRVPLDSSYIFERRPDGSSLVGGGLSGLRASREVILQPYDHVLIFRQPQWELQRTVVVSGEVRYPGRYALRSKNERIADVIERAGGLTRDAYPGGVVFVRADRELGRIGLDLPGALKNRRHRDNILLVDRDSIFVPVYSSVVNVRGAVNSPVAVAYVPGRDIDFYISSAGGVTRLGDLRRAFVTQPGGKVESRQIRGFITTSKPVPHPGGSVFVPERLEGDRRDLLQVLSVGAQLIGTLVTILAVTRNM